MKVYETLMFNVNAQTSSNGIDHVTPTDLFWFLYFIFNKTTIHVEKI